MAQYIDISIPTPKQQGIFAVGVGLLMMLIGKLGGFGVTFPWLVSGAFMLLFSLFNNGFAIFSDHFGKYVQASIPVFGSLVGVLGMGAYALSGTSIFSPEVDVYRTIYTILILGYFSLMVLCLLVRRVADFLRDRDEEQHKR